MDYIAGSVVTIGLSNSWYSHSNKPVWQKIDQSRSLSCGDFKDLRRFRKNLLFFSSLKKTKGGSAHTMILPLLEEVFFFSGQNLSFPL